MKKLLALTLLPTICACGTIGRLGHVGVPPKLSAMETPAAPPAEQSITQLSLAERRGLPPASPELSAASQPSARMDETEPASSASLFRASAGALFHDQRASRVGDILTIRINIADKATIDNATSRTRSGSESGGASSLFGLEKVIKKIAGIDTSNLVGSSTNSSATGKGNTTRSETINMTMAAIVTGVLPNGNLIVRGKQETRVNNELRELIVTGIVRPQDIARDNSIRHTQIAEARISYGGRGQLTDAQQARWGQQLLDIFSPF